MIKLSTLNTICNAAANIDILRPNTGNAKAFRQAIAGMPDAQIGELARQLDTLVLNCKLLQHEEVEIVMDTEIKRKG